MSFFHCQEGERFENEECIKWLRDAWKCDIVRLPILPEAGPYSYRDNPEGTMQRIDEFLKICVKLGMYGIVDFHGGGDPTPWIKYAKSLFAKVSSKYGNLPNLIYESYNEPDGKKDPWKKTVRPFHMVTVKEIRRNDPDNLILLGTPGYCLNVDMVLDAPVTGFGNIAYVTHFYAASHKQGIRDKVKKVLAAGYPVFVSEFGTCEYTGSGRFDPESTIAWMKFMRANKISWCNWALNDKKETASALMPKANSDGHWTERELTPSGKLIRKCLEKYR